MSKIVFEKLKVAEAGQVFGGSFIIDDVYDGTILCGSPDRPESGCVPPESMSSLSCKAKVSDPRSDKPVL